MSYAAMDGSATQFAGQNGYMPECVRERDDESRRDDDDEDPIGCRCRLKRFFDLKMKSRHRRSYGRREGGEWTRAGWVNSNDDD